METNCPRLIGHAQVKNDAYEKQFIKKTPNFRYMFYWGLRIQIKSEYIYIDRRYSGVDVRGHIYRCIDQRWYSLQFMCN